MSNIRYIDRQTKKEETEMVYGNFFIELLYGNFWISRIISFLILPVITRISFLSQFYGFFQRSSLSKFKIRPFIEKFKVDTSEFLEPVDSFCCFNDFFIRKLNPSCRPIANGNDVAILPADARYLVYANFQTTDGIVVKGKKFSLEKLLKSSNLAHKYTQGSVVLARLCPVDYHRFHFPCNGVPEASKVINGPLYSVNPLSLKRNIQILNENKRVITTFHTKSFGTVLYIEIGATHVGSVHQTFTAGEYYAKGDEKGFFSFGGSCIILLFEPFRIQFDQDLIDASHRKIEVRGLYGQPLGRALSLL
jgi:phosphatidylserine decarboxylase